jgi:hypothetical protein
MWTESGIAFELKVFGGRIHPLSSRIDCKFGLACLDYPLKELYDKEDNVLYALPMDYISKLQQKETWEQDFSKTGTDVFFVPRTGCRSNELNGTNLMIWENETDADISDHIDNQDTQLKRMDDGSIVKNPKAGNRKPQRQSAVHRYHPYNDNKRKNAVEGGAPCVSKEVLEIKDEEEEQKLEIPENTDAGKGGSDQDMI